MAEIKSSSWTRVDRYTHLEHPMKMKWQTLHYTSSSRAMQQNMSAPSLIKWTRLDCNDSYSSISFEPLIKDEVIHRACECPIFP